MKRRLTQIKRRFTQIIFLGIVIFSFATCFDQFVVETTLNFNFGGSGERSVRVQEGMLGQLNYIIRLSKDGESMSPVEVDRGKTSVSIPVTAGLWLVGVEAFYNGSLYATGFNSVEVKTGRANPVSIELEVTKPYSISLSADGLLAGNYTFSSLPAGYEEDDIIPLTVIVKNIGVAETGDLAITLSNDDGFNLPEKTINSIAVNLTNTFTVKPNTGLEEGTYTATVTVFNDYNDIKESFTVIFVVGAPVITSIEAVYDDDIPVYLNTTLEELKDGLTVTAIYSNGSSESVTDYTLSGELTFGPSTITVSYNGFIKPFDVTVKYPRNVPFVITGTSNNYTATLGTYTAAGPAAIQTVINGIRKFNAENFEDPNCEIQFGNGVDTLDIGTSVITFANTATEEWGKITLLGRITSESASGATNKETIVLNNDISIDVKGYIEAKGADGIAINNTSTGKITVYTGATVTSGAANERTILLSDPSIDTGVRLEIKGGTVQNTRGLLDDGNNPSGAQAIDNQSAGQVLINGGTVSAYKGRAIRAINGTIIINGDETLITSENQSQGTISINNAELEINGGTIQNTLDYEYASAIYVDSNGTVTIKGGTVQVMQGDGMTINNWTSTGEVSIIDGTVKATIGIAIYNRNNGEVNVKGGEVSATSGTTIYNNGNNGKINVTGGTISTETGTAIHNQAAGTITISGTIAKIEVTDDDGYAIYNNSTGIVTVEDENTIIGNVYPEDLLGD